jgi:hypothetical protein
MCTINLQQFLNSCELYIVEYHSFIPVMHWHHSFCMKFRMEQKHKISLSFLGCWLHWMTAQCCKIDVVCQCVDVVLMLDWPSLYLYAGFCSCQHCRGSVFWKNVLFWKYRVIFSTESPDFQEQDLCYALMVIKCCRYIPQSLWNCIPSPLRL